MTATREQEFAEHVARLRQQHPVIRDSYWEGMEKRQRLQWRIDDLTHGIARLVGKYGYRAERDPGNVSLVQLVAELDALQAADLAALNAEAGGSSC